MHGNLKRSACRFQCRRVRCRTAKDGGDVFRRQRQPGDLYGLAALQNAVPPGFIGRAVYGCFNNGAIVCPVQPIPVLVCEKEKVEQAVAVLILVGGEAVGTAGDVPCVRRSGCLVGVRFRIIDMEKIGPEPACPPLIVGPVLANHAMIVEGQGGERRQFLMERTVCIIPDVCGHTGHAGVGPVQQ